MLKLKLVKKFMMVTIIVIAASMLVNVNGNAATIHSSDQRLTIVLLMSKPPYKFISGKHSVLCYRKCLIKKFNTKSKSEINQFKKDARKLEHQFDF